jgi:hypothetical protein
VHQRAPQISSANDITLTTFASARGHFARPCSEDAEWRVITGEEMSMIKIAKRKIAKGVYLLRFKTQYELAATFIRVQEHYESSRFYGRIFSLEQFMDWYAKRYGNFTY